MGNVDEELFIPPTLYEKEVGGLQWNTRITDPVIALDNMKLVNRTGCSGVDILHLFFAPHPRRISLKVPV